MQMEMHDGNLDFPDFPFMDLYGECNKCELTVEKLIWFSQ